MDLQFPHHENEIAQSEGASGGPFVNYWMHNGFLNVDDEKMSKSLGNFFTIRDVLKKFDGETIRFFMLRTHYRSPFNFSDAQPRRRDAARCAASTPRSDAVAVDAGDGAGRLERAARAPRFRDGDERRLQHADRGRRPVRAGRRGEPHASRPTRPLLQGARRARSACCSRRRARSCRPAPALDEDGIADPHRGAARGQGARRLRPRRCDPRGAGRRRASCSRTARKAPPG